MKRRLLAVQPQSMNYPDYYEVSVAYSYPEAERMIEEAEKNGQAYDQLDLSVRDTVRFREFVDWMEGRQSKYPFSIFGYASPFLFSMIKNEARRRGFDFCD